MNTGYLVEKALTKILKKKGISGLRRDLTKSVGASMAKLIVQQIAKGGVRYALRTIGGRIGRLFGFAGTVLGLVAGAL